MIIAVLLHAALVAISCPADEEAEAPALPKIPPGVKVQEDADGGRWNRLVLMASPKISSGSLDAVADSIRDAAGRCSLTLIATVARDPASESAVLREIGVGYSVRSGDDQIIVSSDTVRDIGLDFGFIERQILRTNEAQLKKVRVIGRSSTVVVFDTPAVMLVGDKHERRITRHFCWVNAASGKGAMMVWLLTEDYQASGKAIRVVPWGTREDRKVHVDGDAFGLFGIPTSMAFALERLPPGADLPWTAEAKRVATRQRYGQKELGELVSVMNERLAELKAGHRSDGAAENQSPN